MNYHLLFIILLLSFFTHFFIQQVFSYLKKFDDFNERSSHIALATRTGGIGIFITIFFTALFFYFKDQEIFEYKLLIPLGIIFIIGVYDDFYRADFKLKFLIQIIVAKLLIDQGFVISNFHGFLGLYEVPWVFAQLVTVFVFIIIVNAINFIDGIDGLAITQVIKSIILIEFFSSTQTQLSFLSFLIIVTLIPLYFFNFKKNQKIFLGDGGSMFLGSFLAIYIFYLLSDQYSFGASLSLNKTFFSVLVLLYPLVDLLRVFVMRISKGKSPFNADQKHIHHYLIGKLKLSHFKALVVIILVESLFLFLTLFTPAIF